MPCYSPENDLNRDENRKDYKNAVRKLNKLTDMLCRVCTYLETNNQITALAEDIQDWWEDHKEFDLKRKGK